MKIGFIIPLLDEYDLEKNVTTITKSCNESNVDFDIEDNIYYYDNLGYNAKIFAYPNGKYTELSEKLIRSMGAKVTLTTRVGMNYICKGDPESLYLLRRYSINEDTDVETLQSYLDGKIPGKTDK